MDVIDSRSIGEPFARMMAPKQSVCQTNGISIMHLKWTLATLVLCAAVHLASAEYENTWNFYYEQPCCGNTNGHHIRHHRGNLNVFFVMNIEICLGKPSPTHFYRNYYRVDYRLSSDRTDVFVVDHFIFTNTLHQYCTHAR